MDSPAHPSEELGVTRLDQTCGHLFCRKDIRNWMREGRSTCPTCRRPFLSGAQARALDDTRITIATVLLRPMAQPANLPENMDPENMPWIEELVIPILEGRQDPAQARPSPHPSISRDEEHDEDRSSFAAMYS
ncbi:hypothetical protein OBBRIDRAFT_791822 [Obba rivulosa]|uniref:Zinc finger C3HC4 RING-type domain-containing protein n=1 Tax=Obba rivulosa TaxID=1052685 RepID=A0A8E2AVQ5_9APHY|nr:hypothetical protein OBBRIDRAFT_791822 [Obba rivulosa]